MSDRWDEHFLRMALEQCRMSKDPRTRVGAVIVGPDREVRSTGFNGFPRLVCDSPDRLNDQAVKLKLMVHAEMNAVLAAARTGVALKGCTLYLAATDGESVWGGPPCIRCSVEIIQAGIVCIVSRPRREKPSKWHEDMPLTAEILNEAGVERRYLPVPFGQGLLLDPRYAVDT